MLRLWTDFNAATDADECFLLRHDDEESRLLDAGSVQQGQRVLLFQDDDDFDVEAELRFGYLDALQYADWYAVPDWSTMRRFGK